MKLKPEILCQPNVPTPLHGMAPRVVFGESWWNMKRQAAYQSSGNCCIACGRPAFMTETGRLEAHEMWEFDYENGVGTVIDIVPLCHYCHNFIHSGRLYMVMGEEKTRDEVRAILEHGFKILAENNLKAFPFTVSFAREMSVDTHGVQPYPIGCSMKQSGWKMVYNGKEYKPEDYVK